MKTFRERLHDSFKQAGKDQVMSAEIRSKGAQLKKRARLRGVAVLAVLVTASALAFPVFGMPSADRPLLLDVGFVAAFAGLTACLVVFFWRTLNPFDGEVVEDGDGARRRQAEPRPRC